MRNVGETFSFNSNLIALQLLFRALRCTLAFVDVVELVAGEHDHVWVAARAGACARGGRPGLRLRRVEEPEGCQEGVTQLMERSPLPDVHGTGFLDAGLSLELLFGSQLTTLILDVSASYCRCYFTAVFFVLLQC